MQRRKRRANAIGTSYGRLGPEGTRCSSLQQINRTNVARLRRVWSYDTQDGSGDPQTQPIMVQGVLYGLTPRHKVVALNAATGKLIWSFDSGIVGRGANRSVVYWGEGKDRRGFSQTSRSRSSMRSTRAPARPSRASATRGRIDLREGLGREAAKQSIILTSPGIIYKDLLIMGGRTPGGVPAATRRAYPLPMTLAPARCAESEFHTVPASR